MIKKSLSLQGHRTSVALEREFWEIIEDVAESTGTSLPAFISARDAERLNARPDQGLASYLRVWVLSYISAKRANQK